MFLSMKVTRNVCVDTWSEDWMSKAYTLAWDVVVFVPLALMVGLYSRVVYTLWFKRDDDNQPNHQQRVSVFKSFKIYLSLHRLKIGHVMHICWGPIPFMCSGRIKFTQN